MKSDQKNVWLAMAIIIAMFVGWQFFYELPRIQQEQEAQQRQEELSAGNTDDATLPELGGVDSANVTDVAIAQELPREDALAISPRININTPSLHGSVALTGGRLDDLTPGRLSHRGRAGLARGRPALACWRPLTLFCRIRLDRRGPQRGGPRCPLRMGIRQHGVDA